ncbi:hypothetical protein DP939_39290 [Spongiactinospora rosea]|uniref:Uncharacterized protein n=1 Tax=Spongiactinospora rosea TaxID=2248750 RepID=A0A366LL47_9ACTN|nr:hypothetical protein DP939_39290 [Spongiactinospora rosea]
MTPAASIVEADRWQSCFVGEPVELVGEVLGVQWVSEFAGGDEPAISPVLTGGELFFGLLGAWWRRAATLPASMAMVRSLASVFGLPWMGCQSSWTICQLIPIVLASSLTSRRLRLAASPRRGLKEHCPGSMVWAGDRVVREFALVPDLPDPARDVVYRRRRQFENAIYTRSMGIDRDSW